MDAIWLLASGLLGAVVTAFLTRRTNTENETLKSSLDRAKQRDFQRRLDQLNRVNDQLRLLYGPLHALSRAGDQSWLAFRKRHRPQGAFWGVPGDPPTRADETAWRHWMKTVFMPLNLKMEELILTQAHLLEGASLDESMVLLCAHVESYKTVLQRWENQDFADHVAPVVFPERFPEEVTAVYATLRARQKELLDFIDGELRGDALVLPAGTKTKLSAMKRARAADAGAGAATR